jgi:RNA polymerase sigma-70 factor (ECF subfamily)
MTADAERLIADARSGDSVPLSRLLELYRNYLRLLARVELGRRLQAKVDPSDVVQEALLDAHRYFPTFRGTAEGQFVGWLREILAGVLANQVRRYLGTQARNVRLERQIADGLGQSSVLLDRGLVADQSSPSEQAARVEQAVILADALARLPDDYREVILLRNFEGLTFPQAAERMARTLDSVEKLWLRALARLRQQLTARGGAA